MNLAKTLFVFSQAALLIALAPLLTGIIKKVKAAFQFRTGPPVLQPYYDLAKYCSKETVVSDAASWIFHAAPYAVLAACAACSFFTPSVSFALAPSATGDVILVVYLMALARFFMALAAMDTASAFGGMASSREMMISSIAEPALILCFISLAASCGSANLAGIMARVAERGDYYFAAENIFVLFALFLIVIAETGRVPFDNPATHLELTMVHEGMILEYSGKYLAMIHMASYIKQAVLFTIVANVFFPYAMAADASLAAFVSGSAALAAKLVVFSVLVGVFESSIAKSRLFQLPDLIGIAFILALTSIVSSVMR